MNDKKKELNIGCLEHARELYTKGKINMFQLEYVFLICADESELKRYENCFEYDKPGVLLGLSQKQLDDEWNKLEQLIEKQTES